MNAQELFFKGKPAGVWFCEKCKRISVARPIAENCCVWKCTLCGKPCEEYWTKCEGCRADARRAQEEDMFNKAQKIPATKYGGWVYVGGFYGEFFGSVDEFLEEWENETDGDVPKYIWACKPVQWVNADIDMILNCIGDDAPEDFDFTTLNEYGALEAAIQKFNELNSKQVIYQPDYALAVVLAE